MNSQTEHFTASTPNSRRAAPKDAHIALVRCGNTRCMAYREKPDRKWRDYFYHDELAGDVEVICYL